MTSGQSKSAFGGKGGHNVDIAECPLMTLSGHWCHIATVCRLLIPF